MRPRFLPYFSDLYIIRVFFFSILKSIVGLRNRLLKIDMIRLFGGLKYYDRENILRCKTFLVKINEPKSLVIIQLVAKFVENEARAFGILPSMLWIPHLDGVFGCLYTHCSVLRLLFQS